MPVSLILDRATAALLKLKEGRKHFGGKRSQKMTSQKVLKLKVFNWFRF